MSIAGNKYQVFTSLVDRSKAAADTMLVGTFDTWKDAKEFRNLTFYNDKAIAACWVMTHNPSLNLRPVKWGQTLSRNRHTRIYPSWDTTTTPTKETPSVSELGIPPWLRQRPSTEGSKSSSPSTETSGPRPSVSAESATRPSTSDRTGAARTSIVPTSQMIEQHRNAADLMARHAEYARSIGCEVIGDMIMADAEQGEHLAQWWKDNA